MSEATEMRLAMVERARPLRASWSIQRCQSSSGELGACCGPKIGRTRYCSDRRMAAIVVSEYGLPRPGGDRCAPFRLRRATERRVLEEWAKSGRERECRRRDSNPRHADYDSDRLTSQ